MLRDIFWGTVICKKTAVPKDRSVIELLFNDLIFNFSVLARLL